MKGVYFTKNGPEGRAKRVFGTAAKARYYKKKP
jgi:hypothetical protein